jgi:hypothetical protein
MRELVQLVERQRDNLCRFEELDLIEKRRERQLLDMYHKNFYPGF